jgi:YfiH family protein
VAHSRFTLRDAGDLRSFPPADGVVERRREAVDLPWRVVRQVHGAAVVVVTDPTDESDPVEADALVTDLRGVVLSVNVADCAPVAIVSRQSVVAAVHAGWKGVEAGVIEATVDTMRRLGARDLMAWLGPCVHPECYEFGVDDLAGLEQRYGRAVRTRTASGAVALDLPMAVGAALGGAGVALVGAADACTACDATRFFSHRARGDTGRHALAVWIEP